MASITRSYQATFQIINLSVGAGGSGVAVWRDSGNNNVYVATAYHVVEGMASGMFVDYIGRKYTNYNEIILDKTYDFALVELRGVPSNIPTVTIATPRSTITHGADVYVIGWPLLMDTNSVSTGALRSPKWNANGTMNQLLISAPVFGGNSGGGVFLKSSNELLGVVSWGLTNDETMNGIVPYTIIMEALFYFMYRPATSLTTPSKISGESYLFGIEGLLIDPFTMQYWLQPTLPALDLYGSVGAIVLSTLPGSPATAAGFTSLSRSANIYTFDILWGIRHPGGSFIYVTEENSIDSILYSFHVTTNHTRRRIIPRRSRGEAAYAGLNIVLPNSLQIECLTSRVVNDIHDNNFITKTVTLVKRDSYYQLVGDDQSSFGNEFLFGTRNDLRKELVSKKLSGKMYGKQLLENISNRHST